MAHCFIISGNISFINSTEKCVKKYSYYKPEKILLKPQAYANAIETWRCISKHLSGISFFELGESVVLVDEYFNVNNCNAIEYPETAEIFWSRMILSFPELEFIFLNSTLEGSRAIIDWLENETADKKNKAFLALFDFTGIRNHIRNKCRKGLQERVQLARIIEDESSYAFFHAYIAYKNNRRSKLYTTFNHLSQDKESKVSADLQIQDLSLGFIDDPGNVDFKSIEKRYSDFKLFSCVRKGGDFLITAGEELDSKTKEKLNITQIHKPTKGIYDISKKINLNKASVQKTEIVEHNNNHHSAPGMLALIAETLICRAQEILDNAKQVEEAVHAAMLALEAKEMLNGLTPTLALQALSLQQKAEVTAECLFVGTEYNIDLKPRFDDLNKEVTFITTASFAESERSRAQLNIQLKIAETLSGVYGNYKQFEEELECLNKARDLNFRLKGKALVPFLLLLSWSMNRIKNFGILLLICQLFFSLLYYIFFKIYYKTWQWDISWRGVWSEVKAVFISIVASVKYFFTSETSDTFQEIFRTHEVYSGLIRGFQGFCALSSLSIFVAMIYLRFSRK